MPFATALIALLPSSRWGDLPAEKAIVCGVAAVILFVASLLLRGVLRLVSLLLLLVLAAGAFWLMREGWNRRSDLLPPEWRALAEKALPSPQSKAAWRSIQSELSQLSSTARERIANGGEEARRALLIRLDAKARDLRKSGSTLEAEELLRLRDLLAPRKESTLR